VFGLDPARTTAPPFHGLDLPQLRAAMLAVDAELTAGGAGGVGRENLICRPSEQAIHGSLLGYC
jgi:hypothetical protein